MPKIKPAIAVVVATMVKFILGLFARQEWANNNKTALLYRTEPHNVFVVCQWIAGCSISDVCSWPNSAIGE